MLKKLLSATVFASSLVLANAIFVAPALAEVVYNRGNERIRSRSTSTRPRRSTEAHIMRDLYEGLVTEAAKGELIARRRRELDRVGRRPRLHLQAARRTRSGRTAIRSPPTISSLPIQRIQDPGDGGRIRQHPLSDQERREGQQGRAEARRARRQGGRRPHAGDHARGPDALFPRTC